MSMSSVDATDAVVRMMLSGTEITLRLTASATKNLVAISIALAKSHKKLYGRTNLKKMLRGNPGHPGIFHGTAAVSCISKAGPKAGPALRIHTG